MTYFMLKAVSPSFSLTLSLSLSPSLFLPAYCLDSGVGVAKKNRKWRGSKWIYSQEQRKATSLMEDIRVWTREKVFASVDKAVCERYGFTQHLL